MDDLVMIRAMQPSVMDSLGEKFDIQRYWEAENKAEFLTQNQATRFLATNGHDGCSAESRKQSRISDPEPSHTVFGNERP